MKNLGLKTTFINRANTNEEVFRRANAQVKREGSKKQIVTFEQAYKKFRTKRLAKTVRGGDDCPIHNITIDHGLKYRRYPLTRQGGPKQKWLHEIVKDLWTKVKNGQEELNLDDQEHVDRIKQHLRTLE